MISRNKTALKIFVGIELLIFECIRSFQNLVNVA